MTIPLLQDVVIMLGAAFSLSVLFQKLKLPSIVIYIFAGILIGPSSLNLVSSITEIKLIAEVGVILLLFTIGLEFSIERLLNTKKLILLGGSLQVLLTVLLTYLSSLYLKFSWQTAVFLGFLIAISSTAIVFKIIQKENHLNTEFGKRMVGILIFQDLAVIPMILGIPLLSGESKDIGTILMEIILTLVYLVIAVLGFRWITQNIYSRLLKDIDPEITTIGFILLCFILPLITGHLNISFALGAFLAGLVVSETKFKHQVFESVENFKEIFACIFFVSIGLLLNLQFIFTNFDTVLLVTLAVTIINLLATTIAISSVHNFSKSAISAVALIQIGEFSFVLSQLGLEKKIISQEYYNIFLAVAVLSMISTPYLYKLSFFLEKRFTKTKMA